jgi:hypothetical protein
MRSQWIHHVPSHSFAPVVADPVFPAARPPWTFA